MAIKKIIAFYMHEDERATAQRLMPAAMMTDSFATGEVDESKIPEMEQAGILVQTQPTPAPAAPMQIPKPGGVLGKGFGIAPRSPLTRSSPPPTDAIGPAPIDYYVVNLQGPLLEPWRDQLGAMGVELLELIPNQGYKARLKSAQVPLVGKLDFVQAVTWLDPARSAPKRVTRSLPPSFGLPPAAGRKMLTYDVRVHDPADVAKVQQWLETNHVAISGTATRKIRFFVLQDSPVLDDLAQLPEVDVVSEYVIPKLSNDAARRILGIDQKGNPASTSVISQDGTGQIVAIADTGIDDQHPDFQGRIAGKIARGRPNDASDPNGHGTHVAGSVLGDGSASNGVLKGTAPKATLFFQSLLDANGELGGLPVDLNDLFNEAYQAGARIHNNSWGAATPATYTIDSEEVDEFIHSHPDMLVVIAAGNEGNAATLKKSAPGFVDWLSIGSPASCKNALTVGASRSDRTDGALSSITWGTGWPSNYPHPPIAQETISGDPNSLAAFSSRGPCDDRRIKPDVVAPGTDIASTKSSLAPISNYWGPYPANVPAPNPNYAFDGGTSMATPLVTGCAALIRQYYVTDRNHQPSAALLKASLINSTVWLSGTDATAPSKGTPNYHQGHGRVSMQNALPSPANPNLQVRFIDNWADKTTHFTRTGERRRYQFTVPPGAPEVRLTLAYTDAPARGLQNNINVVLQHQQSGKKWTGNSDIADPLLSPDPDNNVETIRIANPPDGVYFVQVFVGNMLKPPQDFALVVTGNGISALTPI